MTPRVARGQRWTAERPCPICGGHDKVPRGKGLRCYGFMGIDGRYAHCVREELAGKLPMEAGSTYAHRLDGDCRCGSGHGAGIGNDRGSADAGPGTRARVISETIYDYEGGLRVVRKDFSDGNKSFAQWHADGDRYVPGRGDVELTLYRAPDLRAADLEAFVFLVEGERCVDFLRMHELVSVTTPGGSGQWAGASARAAELLKGRHVVILPDHDKPGGKYAAAALETLRGVCASVRVVELPGLEDSEDVIDWFRHHDHDAENLVRLAVDTPAVPGPEPILIFAAEDAERTWLVPLSPPLKTGIASLDLLTGGLRPESVYALNGPPGKGKSGLVLQITRKIARDGRTVLYVTSELSKRQAFARLSAQERRLPWIEVFDTGPSETGIIAASLRGLPILVRELTRGMDFLRMLMEICDALGYAPLLVLDYLQHAARRINPNEPRFATAFLSDSLSLWTKETHAPVLAVSGIARVKYEPDDDRHGAQLQGSGKDAGEIDYDAAVDMVLLTDGTRARLEVAKNRFGPTGTIGLCFEPRIGTFEEDATASLSELDWMIVGAIRSGADTYEAVAKKVMKRNRVVSLAIARLVAMGLVERAPIRVVESKFPKGSIDDW